MNESLEEANLFIASLNKLKLNKLLTLLGLKDGCILSFIILKFRFNEKAYDVPSCSPLFTNFLYVGILIPVKSGSGLFCGFCKNVIPYKLVASIP